VDQELQGRGFGVAQAVGNEMADARAGIRVAAGLVGSREAAPAEVGAVPVGASVFSGAGGGDLRSGKEAGGGMRAAAGEEGWAGVGAGRRERRSGGSWDRPPGRRWAGFGAERCGSLSIRTKLWEVHRKCTFESVGFLRLNGSLSVVWLV
jgi:hypothetical protein